MKTKASTFFGLFLNKNNTSQNKSVQWKKKKKIRNLMIFSDAFSNTACFYLYTKQFQQHTVGANYLHSWVFPSAVFPGFCLSWTHAAISSFLLTEILNSRVCKQISKLIENRNIERNNTKSKNLSSFTTDHLHLLYFVVQVLCSHKKKKNQKNKIDVYLLCKWLISNKDENEYLKC